MTFVTSTLLLKLGTGHSKIQDGCYYKMVFMWCNNMSYITIYQRIYLFLVYTVFYGPLILLLGFYFFL